MKGLLKSVFAIFIGLLLSHSLLAQDDKEPKLFLNGYLKNMVISDFSPDDSTLWTNLVHNRMNLKWYPNDNLSGYFELRTRFYYGDYVEIFPGFASQLSATEDYFDLSWLIIGDEDALFQEDPVLLHTMIDRFYLEWQKNDWAIKAGRQRINWGVNLVWNPNDLFNAFSFVDFDYEERPGSDALRIQKYTGFASSIDVAVKAADDLDDFVAAGRWSTNKGGYDLHLLGGFARNDVTIGGAWAGNLNTAGFKGEFTYFLPVNDNPRNNAFVGTLTYDYVFKSELYFMASYLYNSDGNYKLGPEGFAKLFTDRALTARDLSPYRHSSLVQVMYPFHPLVNGGLAVMYFPWNKGLFLNPVVTVSILQNFDFDLVGQIYFDEDPDPNSDAYKSLSEVLYYRLKWSF
jgi:hypothetical protein